MLQPFTRTLNFRIISISLEFSKNETATVSRPYSAPSFIFFQYTTLGPLHSSKGHLYKHFIVISWMTQLSKSFRMLLVNYSNNLKWAEILVAFYTKRDNLCKSRLQKLARIFKEMLAEKRNLSIAFKLNFINEAKKSSEIEV